MLGVSLRNFIPAPPTPPHPESSSCLADLSLCLSRSECPVYSQQVFTGSVATSVSREEAGLFIWVTSVAEEITLCEPAVGLEVRRRKSGQNVTTSYRFRFLLIKCKHCTQLQGSSPEADGKGLSAALWHLGPRCCYRWHRPTIGPKSSLGAPVGRARIGNTGLH